MVRRAEETPGFLRRQQRAGDHVVDIFDEVEEDLRAERAQQLLKRYGGLIVAVLVLIVAGVAGWEGWRWYQARQDAAAAVEFLTAMNLATPTATGTTSAANRTVAIAAFGQIGKSGPEGYATLARLRDAALKADAGDLPGATVLWDQVAADGAADPLLRDLATLSWAQHYIDTGDPGLLEGRLKVLASPDNPWRTLAEEQLALLDLRLGKTDQAKTTLRRLAQDVMAPSGVRGRASGLLSRLGG